MAELGNENAVSALLRHACKEEYVVEREARTFGRQLLPWLRSNSTPRRVAACPFSGEDAKANNRGALSWAIFLEVIAFYSRMVMRIRVSNCCTNAVVRDLLLINSLEANRVRKYGVCI
ncbi:uncharacterized protein N7473_005597 [Penicillium subrubescens]|uniref:uncharacterized protein n=1 Tax=Penicillium subrubescens TaxID=1316194 RepID=UPI0025451363|nr:uncharacterized protein N7473_005597 [Penicillium subrubescens]KAJ5896198.1 hypothetical protein N7473_005597 [Penicillium subrubescens]